MASQLEHCPSVGTPPTSISGSTRLCPSDLSVGASTPGTVSTLPQGCGSPWPCFPLPCSSLSVSERKLVCVVLSRFHLFNFAESLVQSSDIAEHLSSMFGGSTEQSATQQTSRSSTPKDISSNSGLTIVVSKIVRIY